MNSKEIIDYLKSEASEKYKENVIKMGIPEKFCIGVSTSTLRKFAKKLDKSNELAFELWNTHYHEARLLAVLRFISQRKQSSNLDCQRCHKGIRNCRESKRTETLNYF